MHGTTLIQAHRRQNQVTQRNLNQRDLDTIPTHTFTFNSHVNKTTENHINIKTYCAIAWLNIHIHPWLFQPDAQSAREERWR